MVKADKRARAKITPERQGELLANNQAFAGKPRRNPTVTGEHHDSASGLCSFFVSFPDYARAFLFFTMNPTILSEELCITRCLQT